MCALVAGVQTCSLPISTGSEAKSPLHGDPRHRRGPLGGVANELSGADSHAPALLVGARLRHPPALRHGGGRRHVSSGDDVTRARARAVARGLCSAVAPAIRRTLRREPEPPPALLPVSGYPEAVARLQPAPLPREPVPTRDHPPAPPNTNADGE